MSKDKIIVDFVRVEHILIAKITNTPDELRGGGEIIRSADYTIYSRNFPEIFECALYLHGSEAKRDNKVVLFEYSSAACAERAMDNFISLIEDYNSMFEIAALPAKSALDIEYYKGAENDSAQKTEKIKYRKAAT